MKVEVLNVFDDNVSCTFCDKGTLGVNQNTLIYPYKHVVSMAVDTDASPRVYICGDCLNEFQSKVEIHPKSLVKKKLTKSVLNDFIQWSTSRYNDYLGYGTKKENVDIIFNSLKAGYYIGFDKKIFEIICAGSVGENGNGRYWKTKTGGDEYIVNCEEKTITAKYSKRLICFS